MTKSPKIKKHGKTWRIEIPYGKKGSSIMTIGYDFETKQETKEYIKKVKYQNNPAAEQILVTLLYSDKLNIFRYRRYINGKIAQEAAWTETELKDKLGRASNALVNLYFGAMNTALMNPNEEIEVIRNY